MEEALSYIDFLVSGDFIMTRFKLLVKVTKKGDMFFYSFVLLCVYLQDIKVLTVLKCKAGNEPYTTLNYIDVRQLTISRKLGAQKQTVILY